MSIRSITPEAVVVEAWGPHAGSLLPSELQLMSGRVATRRLNEFAAGRTCARACLSLLGMDTLPILRGDFNEPLWPEGVVGSITHCEGYCASAIAPQATLSALGIDAEVNTEMEREILQMIGSDPEISRLPASGGPWGSLLFSAKESCFKALFPHIRRGFSPLDYFVVFDAVHRSFEVSLSFFTPHSYVMPTTLSGRYTIDSEYVYTVTAVSMK